MMMLCILNVFFFGLKKTEAPEHHLPSKNNLSLLLLLLFFFYLKNHWCKTKSNQKFVFCFCFVLADLPIIIIIIIIIIIDDDMVSHIHQTDILWHPNFLLFGWYSLSLPLKTHTPTIPSLTWLYYHLSLEGRNSFLNNNNKWWWWCCWWCLVFVITMWAITVVGFLSPGKKAIGHYHHHHINCVMDELPINYFLRLLCLSLYFFVWCSISEWLDKKKSINFNRKKNIHSQWWLWNSRNVLIYVCLCDNNQTKRKNFQITNWNNDIMMK